MMATMGCLTCSRVVKFREVSRVTSSSNSHGASVEVRSRPLRKSSANVQMRLTHGMPETWEGGTGGDPLVPHKLFA